MTAAGPLAVFYADLHVHLGGIKMAASPALTVAGILRECTERKGLDLVGIIDAAAPPALAQIRELVAAGALAEQPGGGLVWEGGGPGAPRRVTLILGCEAEVWQAGPIHLLCYFPTLAAVAEFARWQAGVVKNPSLSTQRHRVPPADLVRQVAGLGGFVVPAHSFTPYKSILAATGSVAAAIPPDLWDHVPAVELGLSADTALAGLVPELAAFALVASSDAHSLGTIAREYTALRLAAPTFAEVRLALAGEDGREVVCLYGLDPRLGKYHRTWCLACQRRLDGPPPQAACPVDPAHPVVMGVLDRIYLLRERPVPPLPRRRAHAPYVAQVPLAFVPGVGPRAQDRLIAAFGSEMAVLHRARVEELAQVVGPELARRIDLARRGELPVAAGAGGRYGRVLLADGPGAPVLPATPGA